MKNYKTLTTLAAAAGLIATTGTASAALTLINTYPTGSTSNIVVDASSRINGFNDEQYTLTTNLSNAEFAPNVLNDPTDGVHGSSTRQSWRGSATSNAGVAEEWIQWDLGASYRLGAIQVWNYNDSSRYDDGISQLDIYFSNVASPGDPEGAGAANWTHWAVDATLLSGTGSAGYTGFDLATVVGSALPAGEFRYVRFEVDSTLRMDGQTLTGSDSNNASLSQIEFFATDVVPEPSTTALLGLGGLALILRRRR